jgi:hypothetical protein
VMVSPWFEGDVWQLQEEHRWCHCHTPTHRLSSLQLACCVSQDPFQLCILISYNLICCQCLLKVLAQLKLLLLGLCSLHR